MRTIIIGDVHGMHDELQALIFKLNPTPEDRVFFLGDLVDKGPDSLKVLRYVRYNGWTVVCGNHEESTLSLYAKAQKAGTFDGLRKVEREPWIKELSTPIVEWMRTFPLIVRPVPGIVLVHGGMFPAYFDAHNNIGEVPAAWHKGGGKRMNRMRRFLRIRHVHRETGAMVTLGEEGETTQPWGDWYDGREGFALYGHAPQRDGQPVAHEHAIGLDTGAVFGGNLTAYVLEDGQHPKAGHFVQVKAGRAYAEWLGAFEAE